MNGEDPLVIKFMMLPDDLILNCLARVSRLYYPILSLAASRVVSMCAYVPPPMVPTHYVGSLFATDQVEPKKFWSRFYLPIHPLIFGQKLQRLVLIYMLLAD
ncbi:unnamed protein product [Arabidopsis halleri]